VAGPGPACGWVLAYVETLASEYQLPLASIFRLPFAAGLALLEARACRLHPGHGLSYIDRAIVSARNATRRRLLTTHRLVTAEPQRRRGQSL